MSILKTDSLAARVWFDRLASRSLEKRLPKLKRISTKTLDENILKGMGSKESISDFLKKQDALSKLREFKKKLDKSKQPTRAINNFIMQNYDYDSMVRMSNLLEGMNR